MPGMAPDDEATGIILDTVPGARSGGQAPGFNATATVLITCHDRRTRTSARAPRHQQCNVTYEGGMTAMSANSTPVAGSGRRRPARRRPMTAHARAGSDVR